MNDTEKNFFCCLLFVIVFVSLPLFHVHGDETYSNWRRVTENGGIEIYLKPVPGSTFKEFRGIVAMNTSIDTILAVFRDVPGHTKWLCRCSNSSLLKEINQFEYITYSVLDAPWPVKDRDSVNYICVSQDTRTKEVTISMKEYEGYFSEHTHRVRISQFEGFWKLKPTKNGNVEVTLQMHIEPGGWIPSWISNRAVKVFPYKTLFNLRKLLKDFQEQ